jgi:hypothetical protein
MRRTPRGVKQERKPMPRRNRSSSEPTRDPLDNKAPLRYARHVTRDTRVQLADARTDRLQPWLLIAIGAATFAAGLGVARGLTRAEREHTQASAAMAMTGGQPTSAPRVPARHPTSQRAETNADARSAITVLRSDASIAAAPVAQTATTAPASPIAQTEPRAVAVGQSQPDQAVAPAHDEVTPAPAPVAPAVTTPVATPTPPVPLPVKATQAVAPTAPVELPRAKPSPRADQADVAANADPAADAASTGFKRVFVAYVRCDGLPQVAGRFPCPRDPWLETHVWRGLNQLTQCGAVAKQRGEGELRLEFDRFGALSLHFEPKGDGTLDPGAVIQCAEQSLARIHTSLHPERMVVAFRFRLQ